MLRKYLMLLHPEVITGGNIVKEIKAPAKPIMPSAPPQKVLDMEFNVEQLPPMDDSEGGPVGDIVKVDPKTKEIKPTVVEKGKKVPTELVEDEPKEDEEKKEDKKEEASGIHKHLKPPKKEGEVKEEKKEVVKQVTVPKGDFDYKGFSQQEVNYLKNMSVEARKFTGELIKQNKEFSKQKDSNYLQHPEAYRLDPQYQAASVDIQFARREAKIWQDTLEQVKLGKPVKLLTAWDDKTGQPIYGNETPATDALEEQLRLNYQTAINHANQVQQQLQQYPQRYQQQIQQDMQAIDAKKNELFEWNTKPELMDYTINIEGLGDRSIKQIKEDFKSMFPPYMRNHKSTDIAADLMVALRIRDSELAEAKASQQVSDIKVEEAKRAEPSSQVKPGKNLEDVHGVKEFKMPSDLEI